MADAFSDTEKLAEVRRELAMRRRVYAGAGMTPKHRTQIAIMQAIATDYEAKITANPGPLFGGNANG